MRLQVQKLLQIKFLTFSLVIMGRRYTATWGKSLLVFQEQSCSLRYHITKEVASLRYYITKLLHYKILLHYPLQNILKTQIIVSYGKEEQDLLNSSTFWGQLHSLFVHFTFRIWFNFSPTYKNFRSSRRNVQVSYSWKWKNSSTMRTFDRSPAYFRN